MEIANYVDKVLRKTQSLCMAFGLAHSCQNIMGAFQSNEIAMIVKQPYFMWRDYLCLILGYIEWDHCGHELKRVPWLTPIGALFKLMYNLLHSVAFSSSS